MFLDLPKPQSALVGNAGTVAAALPSQAVVRIEGDRVESPLP